LEIENYQQTRKIQFSGGATYLVSLPKEWVEELNIKVGENVTIIKNANHSLSIFPKDQNISKKTTAIIYPTQKESEDSIKRKIIATFRLRLRCFHLHRKPGRT